MARPKKYESRELQKGRVFMMEIYPDSKISIDENGKKRGYDPDQVLEKCKLVFVQYAYILHDKDIWDASAAEDWRNKNPGEDFPYELGSQKKAHIHFVGILSASENKQLGLVANELCLPSNYILKCDNKVGAIQYLTHKNYPEKYQYPYEDIVSNIKELRKKYFSDSDSVMKAAQILDYISSCDYYLSLTDVSRWCIQNFVWDEFRRGQHLFSAIINEHNIELKGNK